MKLQMKIMLSGIYVQFAGQQQLLTIHGKYEGDRYGGERG
jgi:hypothetical protein